MHVVQPRGLRRMVIGSLVAHVGIVFAVLLFVELGDRFRPPAQTVLTTKLVRLGEERPKEFLPRKEAPPPSRSRATSPAPRIASRR